MSLENRTMLIVGDARVQAELKDKNVMTADEYLLGRESGTTDSEAVVMNLCRSYDYLSRGYYVSLIADARHQHVYPSSSMIQEIRNPHTYFLALREAGVDTIDFRIVKGRLLPALIVPGREPDSSSDKPTPWVKRAPAETLVRYEPAPGDYADIMSIFGRTTDPRFRKICSAVFKVYPFPLLGIRMYRWEDRWKVGQLFPTSVTRLAPNELALLDEELASKRWLGPDAVRARHSRDRLAVLMSEGELFSPSDDETFRKLKRAGERNDISVDKIGKSDLALLADYDALFLRTVTGFDHYSFVFAQRAEGLGIPVIDRPQCTMRCSNKVYLHELFLKNRIPTPRTATLSRSTRFEELEAIGYPLILKQPDGTFSAAVKKASDRAELEKVADEMFKRSPLLIAQEYTPTPFDWRVGVLDARVLYVCKYHMVRGHWQIASAAPGRRARYGPVEAVPIAEAPEHVTRLALDAVRLIGDGLYGVDIKELAEGPIVIEINDNPDLWIGEEDAAEGDRLYDAIIAAFRDRIAAAHRGE